MWRKLSVFLIFVLSCVSAYADDVTVTTTPGTAPTTIVTAPATTETAPTTTVTTTTAAPSPQQVIVTPAPQSASCKTVSAHWKGNTWIAEQTVCKYTNRTEGVAWVNDYWTCSDYDLTTGNCKTWTYQPGYWVQTLP